ncbi:hypothetical protein QR680_018403 [Steinernema hermaphroditum]|uniref:Uncharacterized protein n=1 Tax=Steinernema hermaphroditum TaxID=289476 RepID=A0AA39HK44_9BILA|nr:hypothetical protein QR680_018403 [Steinernema hermaphroditum]
MRSIRFFIFFVIAFTAVNKYLIMLIHTSSLAGLFCEHFDLEHHGKFHRIDNRSSNDHSSHKHPDFSKQHLFVPAIVVVCIAFAACAIFDIAILICRHHSKKREHKRDMENFEIFGAYAKRLQASTESKMRSNSSDAADTGKKSPKKEPLKDDGKKQPKDDRKKEPLKDGGKKSLNKELLKEDGKKDVIMI